MADTTTTELMQAIKTKKAPGNGGLKGAAILAWFHAHPEGGSAKTVAEAVGCTPGRVYETCKATEEIVVLAPGVYGIPAPEAPADVPAKPKRARKAKPSDGAEQ